METKFKIGHKVLIDPCVHKKHGGKIGVVVEVIPIFESQKQAEDEQYLGKFSLKKDGDTSTAYYRIQCNEKNIRSYLTDDNIKHVNN